jgi:chromosome segregation ATPase
MSSPVIVEPENRKDALSLLDHLDPAIGEATSMVGAMLTELLRRTLRGGVVRIGDEMHGYVADKVDTVIADRTPGLEQLATEVAEHTARTAATEVATEEVRALEERTRASDLELHGKITETRQAVTETAQAVTQTAHSVTEAARAAEQRTKESAATLTSQIRESEQRGQAAFTAQIHASEQRGQAALDEQVQTLIDRSQERSARLKARLAEQDELIGELRKVLESLNGRVAELERPRGLRALWLRLFGRRKAKS